ncbi:pickpocket protein 19-like isoform X1 [Plutella xylostella]|uniref:pickpocket protein 19-like isoform X1 n=1 Tax=Plutella xylostella TaxID=51655 RepID=UPI0020327D4F|nr:pickpocket protein 19-like isoform X1 [Plutella xylostella]
MLYPRENAVFKSVQKQKTSQDAIKDVSVFVRFGRWVFKTSRQFCQYTSIHGFNHIAAPGRMWLERILWIAIVAGATWGAVDISLGQWLRYRDNPTVVTVEKDFRSWTFAFPAVTVCVGNKTDPAKVQSAIKSLWNLEPEDEQYAYYHRFVVEVVNSNLTHIEVFQKYAEDKTLDVDLFKLAVDVMPPLNMKTTWSSALSGRSAKWTPVMTEAGPCYATNSVAIADIALSKIDKNETKDYPFTCKYDDDCYGGFEISARHDFNIHSPFDVADILTKPTPVFPTLKMKMLLSVTEAVCGAGVQDLSVRRRACLYIDEPTEDNKQVYSSNMCRRTCRYRLAMKLCKCKPYYYFYEEGAACSAAGMACLARSAGALVNPACACPLPCLNAVFNELLVDNKFWTKGQPALYGDVRLTVQAPRTRYTREIVFHFQDLVVSFGGAAGLFLGASFLSFIEIFYFILERFSTLCFKPTRSNVVATSKTENVVQMPIPSYESLRIDQLTRILENRHQYRTIKARRNVSNQISYIVAK